MEGFLRILSLLVSHYVIPEEQERAQVLTSMVCKHFQSSLRKNQDMSSQPLLNALNITPHFAESIDKSAESKATPAVYAKAYAKFQEDLRFWLLDWFDNPGRKTSFADFLEELAEQCEALAYECKKKGFAFDDNWRVRPEHLLQNQAPIRSVYTAMSLQYTWPREHFNFCPSLEIGVVQKFLHIADLSFYELDVNHLKCLQAVIALPIEDEINDYCREIYSAVYKPRIDELNALIEPQDEQNAEHILSFKRERRALQFQYAQHFFDKFPEAFFALFRVALVYDYKYPLDGWNFFCQLVEKMAFEINEEELTDIERVFRRYRLQCKLDTDAIESIPSHIETQALLYKLLKPMRACYSQLDASHDLDFLVKFFSWNKKNQIQRRMQASEFIEIIFALLMIYLQQDESTTRSWPSHFAIDTEEPELLAFQDKALLLELHSTCLEALFFDIRTNKKVLKELAKNSISQKALSDWFKTLETRDMHHPSQKQGPFGLFAIPPADPEFAQDTEDDSDSESSLYLAQREEFQQSTCCAIL